MRLLWSRDLLCLPRLREPSRHEGVAEPPSDNFSPAHATYSSGLLQTLSPPHRNRNTPQCTAPIMAVPGQAAQIPGVGFVGRTRWDAVCRRRVAGQVCERGRRARSWVAGSLRQGECVLAKDLRFHLASLISAQVVEGIESVLELLRIARQRGTAGREGALLHCRYFTAVVVAEFHPP